MSPDEGYVTAEDGIRLYFRTSGTGPKLVVIPNGFHLLDDFRRLENGRTLVVYDLRNRGRSEAVADGQALKRGIHDDVEDLEAVRRHFGIDALDVVTHSYVGTAAILYAMKHPSRTGRLALLGPNAPQPDKQYPAHLTGADATLQQVFAQLAELQQHRASEPPESFCRRFWSVLRLLYVVSPADAERIDWGRCELPNERNAMKYWKEHVFPSLQGLRLTAGDLARASGPVLILHGRRDRSAPYGGARDWASLLPNARLVTIEDAGHAPWIEAPGPVFGALEAFLSGTWPAMAETVDP